MKVNKAIYECILEEGLLKNFARKLGMSRQTVCARAKQEILPSCFIKKLREKYPHVKLSACYTMIDVDPEEFTRVRVRNVQ